MGNFQFRYCAKMSGSDEDANVDNVQLVATSLAGPPNQTPTAANDSASTNEDTRLTVDVLANDSDPDSDALQVQSVTQGGHGAVVDNGDGTLTYTPQANYFGSDRFSYTITDGRGGTDTANVSVTITSVNDAPVAVNDSATTAPGQPITINVLANDFDVDDHGTGADGNLWMLPLIPTDHVVQPQRTSDTLRARIVKTITDEEMELLDDELLDLIAAGQQ